MIKVGIGGPRLTFNPAHNDMSHFTPSHWSTNDYVIMDLMEYVEKRQFSDFDMKPNLPQSEIDMLIKAVKNGEEIPYFSSPWGHSLQYWIGRSHGMLWQFNAVNKNLDGYARMAVAIGEKQLVRWSWFDVYVKLPIFKITANILNSLRKKKTDQEWANWQAFLDRRIKKQS